MTGLTAAARQVESPNCDDRPAGTVVDLVVVHGISQWALADYARLIGQVFDPTMAVVFTLKLLLFAITVGLAPTSVALEGGPADPVVRQMRVMARLLAMLILIEAALLILPRL